MTEIKNIEQDNLPALAALYVKVFNQEPWNDKWTEDTAWNRLADILNSPGSISLIMEEDGEAVGAAFGCMEQWYEGREYSLKEYFIDPEKQGQGLGKRLMQALEERVKEEGGENILLFTSRETPAYQFYIKEGFHELKSMAMMAKNL